MLRARHPEETTRIYGDELTVATHYKAPSLRHGAGVLRGGDDMLSLAPRPDEVSAALAHFKVYPDLDAKIAVALSEWHYASRSTEYVFLEAASRLIGAEPTVAAQSRRFTGPEALERAGLLRGP